MRYIKAEDLEKGISLPDRFGIRSLKQVTEDYVHVVTHMGKGFQLNLSSLGHLRADISLPAYAGRMPSNHLAPICNLFDRDSGGRVYSQRITKTTCQDFREKTLSYDNHDGVDFVCPVGTKIVAAAPGIVTLIRDRWCRGGLTITVDHGAGLTTQYTHLSLAKVNVGQKVKRGEVIAASGSSGLEMTTFFPWVPPHLHFMVCVNGAPKDPFLKIHELPGSGNWEQRNYPTLGEASDSDFSESKVQVKLMKELINECKDESIRTEITEVWDNPLSLAALLEDSFHHDEAAWPANYRDQQLRIVNESEQIYLTLPLNWNTYDGMYFADAQRLKG
ncbi:MAG: M23 family metallopeptidase [Flavobacteriales bacterium]|nr:M23 family metallopeptidase [Flavobacteriales bacterium]